MNYLTYTVRIPPELEAETDKAIQMHLRDFPHDDIDDAPWTSTQAGME